MSVAGKPWSVLGTMVVGRSVPPGRGGRDAVSFRPDHGAIDIAADAKTAEQRTVRLIAAGCWCYTGVLAAVLLAFGTGSLAVGMADWGAVPLHLIAIALCGRLALRSTQVPRQVRSIAALAATYGLIVFTANVFFNVWRPLGREPGLLITDTLYMVGYGVFAAIFCVSYRYLGGSFRSRRFWTDTGVIVATLLVAFWAVLLEPIRANGNVHTDVVFTLGYALIFTILMAMAAMVCIQMPRLNAYPALLWLMAAGLVDALWEVPWLAGLLVDGTRLAPLDNVGDALCFTMVVSASAVAPRTATDLVCDNASHGAERAAHNFLPAVATLLAILLVAGAFTSNRTTDSWLLVGLVVSCMLLIVTRQNSVRREVAGLNRELAIREADLRLAELVRQSKDLILIVHGDGSVRFASAAANAVAGTPAGALQGTPFVRLLGRRHEQALAGFLNELLESRSRSATLELTLEAGAGPSRTVNMSGLNQLDSTLIGGLTITIADVTGQRSLEREVLNIATRERVRIAADIHDGMGQELVGIAMLLQGAATDRALSSEGYRNQLGKIVQQLNATISGARALARGLSPLQVVRGSLGHALQRLALDEAGSMEVVLELAPGLEDCTIDDVAADHVYRIAHEAVRNAVRHSGGRTVRVACAIEDEDLVLSVADDGRGIATPPLPSAGIGMRLMQYRAHMIRGDLTVDPLDSGGTCVCLAVPLRHLRQG